MKCFVLFVFSNLNATEYFIEQDCSLPNDARELYIDLIKRCVANTIYEDPNYHTKQYEKELRARGGDWPVLAHTMIGVLRLNNIHYCLQEIFKNNVPGDCIETGVWRGGATILMRAILKAYNDNERKVWVADSFQGLPSPNTSKYPADAIWDLSQHKFLVVPMEQVKENFAKYGLLDRQVVFIKGLFSETLPEASIERISLLRLDGDYYESTMNALETLYPKLSKGGFVIIDDFVFNPCSQAVFDYRFRHNITDPIIPIDPDSAYWKKE